jgi:opacity protein-like surface antigen
VPNGNAEGENMYRVLAVLVFAAVVPFHVLAQDAPRAEVFGGYQYFRVGTGTGSISDFNINGWNASLSGYFNKYFGITADFSGAYGTPKILGVPVDNKLHTFMFGPVLRLPNPTHFTPFVHALGGAARQSGAFLGTGISETDAAWALGGGVDLNIAPIISVRLGQADFLQIRSNGSNQNNFRYSAGIVLRF